MRITKVRITALIFGALSTALALVTLVLIGAEITLTQESTALLLGSVIGSTVTGLVTCSVKLCDDPEPTVPADVVRRLIDMKDGAPTGGPP